MALLRSQLGRGAPRELEADVVLDEEPEEGWRPTPRASVAEELDPSASGGPGRRSDRHW